MIKDRIKAVQNYLVQYPQLRERKNRANFIARLVQKKYPYELEKVSLSRIADILLDGQGYLRAWNHVTQFNEHLRGRDYDDKKMLEQEAQLDIGYTPGYHNDIAR